MDTNALIPYNLQLNESSNYDNILVSHKDLSYYTVENLVLDSKEAIQSTLNGSIYKSCQFSNTTFSRCDICAVRFENCIFRNVDFSSTDIQSTIFSNCKLDNCDFSDALISDCTFTNIQMSTCIFSGSSFTHSIVRNSLFNKVELECSTNTLNKFYDTKFENTCLGNTSFWLHIVKRCTFENVILNSEGPAYLYGCTLENLKSVKFIFLGEHIPLVPIINDDFIKSLIDSFLQKHWYMGAALLSLNFNITTVCKALTDIENILLKQNELGFIINKDEIDYLKNILFELKQEERLPLLIIERYIINIASIEVFSIAKNKELLYNLFYFCRQIKEEMEQEFMQLYHSISEEEGENIEFELIFNTKPTFPFNLILAKFSNTELSSITITGEKQGSYIISALAPSLFTIFLVVKILFYICGKCLELRKNYIEVKKNDIELKLAKYAYEDFSMLRNNHLLNKYKIECDVMQKIIKHPEDFYDVLNNTNSGYQSENLNRINILTSKKKKKNQKSDK